MKQCPQCRRVYDDETLKFCLDDGTSLLYGPGSNEPATALLNVPPSSEDVTRRQITNQTEETPTVTSKRKPIIFTVVVILVVAVTFVAYRSLSTNSVSRDLQHNKTEEPPIHSLAVLPLKPLDAGDNYVGMGIADAIIRRISQTGQLIVRPTSAVRRYLNDDTDALTAAKQLETDAVLEGSLQRSDDRLRVTVNLLRTTDGVSLWNESFDPKITDIFSVQDSVSQKVAARLSLKLDAPQQAGLKKQYTSNPIAYEYYQKAIYAFDQRLEENKERALATVELFKKAIDADPGYALAHAQLAYAYAELATFSDPTDPQWAKLSDSESDRAQQLDPQLAEIHLTRSLIAWSSYGGFQTKAAIRELHQAQDLNPNIGHAELAALYGHVGLTELAKTELDKATEIDPTSDFVKGQWLTFYWLSGQYDDWAAETHRQYGPDSGHPENSVWYLLGKRRIDEAEQRLSTIKQEQGPTAQLGSGEAILSALRGNFEAAERAIPGILKERPVQNPNYHHATFDIACVYALEGKSEEAVKWLQKTADSGYPDYPRFERDPYFDRIRQAPEFIQFMTAMKAEWESYKLEFGQ